MTEQPMIQPPFLEGEKVRLRALVVADVSEDYLAWLNDPSILRHRGSKGYPFTLAEIKRYIDTIPERGDLVLAICERETGRHVGNIALNTILWIHRSAELSIMIGAKDVWGQGLGKETIYLVTCHAFESMGLNRLWAESPNPAFNGAVKVLGWTHEGTKRQAFLIDGRFVDMDCWSMMADEYFAAKKRGRIA
jgi:RimJ/RimL family protein N-acetyltransferase